MSEDHELELYRQHSEAQGKYAYFLLTAAGAGIALAVKVTADSLLHGALIPLAVAVLCWGFSFFYGCRFVELGAVVTRKNIELLQAQRGVHPMPRTPAGQVALAQIAKESIEEDVTATGKAARRQFRFLVAGAVFFVAWHVMEIVLRSS